MSEYNIHEEIAVILGYSIFKNYPRANMNGSTELTTIYVPPDYQGDVVRFMNDYEVDLYNAASFLPRFDNPGVAMAYIMDIEDNVDITVKKSPYGFSVYVTLSDGKFEATGENASAVWLEISKAVFFRNAN